MSGARQGIADVCWASPFASRLAATTGRIEFVILRTGRSRPDALHLPSRGRSFVQLLYAPDSQAWRLAPRSGALAAAHPFLIRGLLPPPPPRYRTLLPARGSPGCGHLTPSCRPTHQDFHHVSPPPWAGCPIRSLRSPVFLAGPSRPHTPPPAIAPRPPWPPARIPRIPGHALLHAVHRHAPG
jgi:hypothetical protein